MFRDWCIRHKYSLLFVLFLICFYGYNISRVYGFTFFPDEFGYWAYAAGAAGYDWSDIASMGSYYSYGYSLILFPIFKLCTNAVTAYRVAVTLNFILLGAVYFLLLGLTEKLCGAAKDRNPFCVAVAVFYPCWLFYAKSTMVEIVLVAVYAAICVLIYHYLENNRWTTLIFMVVSLVYIHFLHMRAVGVLIAGALTLLLYFLLQTGKLRQFMAVILVGTVVLAGGFAVKEWVQDSFYTAADAATVHINDYAGQFGKIRYIFTAKGAWDFAEGFAGKVLYLGLAGFGLPYWGIWYALRQVFLLNRDLRGGKMQNGGTSGRDLRGLFYVFVLLSVIGETLINTIYNIYPLRVDSVVYGRYHEFVLPILMVLGMQELLHTARPWRGTLGIAAVQLPMTLMAADCVNRHQLTNIHGYVMAGMSYVHNAEHFEAVRFLWTAYGFGILLTCLVTLVVAGTGKKARYRFVLTMIIIMEFLLSVRISGMYTDAAAEGTYHDLAVAEKIQELRAEGPERRIVYLLEDEWSFISVLQFMLRDEKIDILPLRGSIEEYSGEELDTDDILVLFFETGFTQEAEKRYGSHLLRGHFYIYYNR